MINPQRIKVGDRIVYPITIESGERSWTSGTFRNITGQGAWPTDYGSVSPTDKRREGNAVTVQLGDIYPINPCFLNKQRARAYLQEELKNTPEWEGKNKDISEIPDSLEEITANYSPTHS